MLPWKISCENGIDVKPNLLAQDEHMLRGPHEPFKQLDWSALECWKSRFKIGSIFKRWFLG